MIATDKTGKVLLVGDALPTELNGVALTLHELTDKQQGAFAALPDDRSGTVFDGHGFTALVPEPAPAAEPTEFEILKAAVMAKTGLTEADLEVAKASAISNATKKERQ